MTPLKCGHTAMLGIFRLLRTGESTRPQGKAEQKLTPAYDLCCAQCPASPGTSCSYPYPSQNMLTRVLGRIEWKLPGLDSGYKP